MKVCSICPLVIHVVHYVYVNVYLLGGNVHYIQ